MFNTGSCIYILTKFNTNGGQIIKKCFLREIISAIKCHMLSKVGKTILVIFFLYSTNIVSYIEFTTFFRQFIDSYVIFHTV